MRIAILLGRVGGKLVPLIEPGHNVDEHKALFKRIVSDDGQFEGKQLEQVLYFDHPARKRKSFNPLPKAPPLDSTAPPAPSETDSEGDEGEETPGADLVPPAGPKETPAQIEKTKSKKSKK